MFSSFKFISFFIIINFYNVMCQLYEGSHCVENGVNGTCVLVNRCKSVVYAIKYGPRPEPCSFKGRVPVICCTDCELVDEASNFVVDSHGFYYNKTGQKAHDNCLQYLVNLDYPCRTTIGSKRYLENTCHRYRLFNISAAVGGYDARRGEYPHMALLGYGTDLDSAQWRCGGSVISDKYILTAGHCTGYGRLGNITYVRLGFLKRSDPIEDWQIYYVKNIIKHPLYNSPVKYHDIALLEVNKRISFGPNILPACLNTGGYDESSATATGWGYNSSKPTEADTLQVVDLNMYPGVVCAGIYLKKTRNLENGYDSKTQSCYGNTQKLSDTCQGDSGGPLQIRSRNKRCMFIIIGITSNGNVCGRIGTAGLYTRVSYYIPWIESIVWP